MMNRDRTRTIGRDDVSAMVNGRPFQQAIIVLIVLNAIAIGLLTLPLPDAVTFVLEVFDGLCVAIYVVELGLRIYADGPRFFRSAWNIFDFAVVALSVVPASILPVPVQVARLFRVFRAFRVMRLISAFDQMRVIVEATVRSVPGVLWTALLMFIVQYVYAVAGISVFAEEFPQYFGDLGRSMFTLFEIMTLEGWNGVAEDVMEVFPWAWGYFMSYVIISAFILMNVVVGVIVNSVEEGRQSIDAALDHEDGTDDELLAARLAELERQVGEVSRLLEDRRRRDARG